MSMNFSCQLGLSFKSYMCLWSWPLAQTWQRLWFLGCHWVSGNTVVREEGRDRSSDLVSEFPGDASYKTLYLECFTVGYLCRNIRRSGEVGPLVWGRCRTDNIDSFKGTYTHTYIYMYVIYIYIIIPLSLRVKKSLYKNKIDYFRQRFLGEGCYCLVTSDCT